MSQYMEFYDDELYPLEQEDRWEDAARLCEQAIQRMAESKDAVAMAASAAGYWRRLGEFARAASNFEKAARYDDLSDTSYYLGPASECFEKCGSLAQAANLWREVALKSHKAEACRNAVLYFIQIGRSDKAVETIEQGGPYPYEDKQLLDQAGKLLQQVDCEDRAAQMYEKAGRRAKAMRVKGISEYNVEETLSLFSWLKLEDIPPHYCPVIS